MELGEVSLEDEVEGIAVVYALYGWTKAPIVSHDFYLDIFLILSHVYAHLHCIVAVFLSLLAVSTCCL